MGSYCFEMCSMHYIVDRLTNVMMMMMMMMMMIVAMIVIVVGML